MASSGFQTVERRKNGKKCAHSDSAVHRIPQRCRARMLGFIFLGLLAGCASGIKLGLPPRVDHLEGLRPGISSKADVLLALGEPRGYGAARLSATLPPWKIWSYEYVESDGHHTESKMLLLFFDDKELYIGHLGYSFAGLLEKTK